MARAMVRATARGMAKAMEDRLHNAAGDTPGGVVGLFWYFLQT